MFLWFRQSAPAQMQRHSHSIREFLNSVVEASEVHWSASSLPYRWGIVQDFALVSSKSAPLVWLGTEVTTWGKAMGQPLSLERMSIDELWVLHEKIGEVLAAKIRAEKLELDRRLGRLYPVASQSRPRRPYPPVMPKFANPDAPEEVWSGRGKKPRWVTEKLSAGLALTDLSIVPSQRPQHRGVEVIQFDKASPRAHGS